LVTEREGSIPEAELRKRFDVLDADKSGTVDAKEFICFSLIDALSHSAGRLVDLLDQIDTDRNRKIDKREFRRAVAALGFDAATEYVDAVFDVMDEDGSGEVDFKELTTALRPSTITRNKHILRRNSGAHKSKLGALVKLEATSEQSVQEQLRALLHQKHVRVMDLFRDWDTKGHGQISPSDFREGIRSLGFTAERQDLDALFAFFDRDRSGTLEFKELNAALRASAPQMRRLPSGSGASSPPKGAGASSPLKGAGASSPLKAAAKAGSPSSLPRPAPVATADVSANGLSADGGLISPERGHSRLGSPHIGALPTLKPKPKPTRPSS